MFIYYAIFTINIMEEGSKMPNEYKSISIPAELIKEIKEYISINKGFTSVSDFIKFAIREELKNKEKGGN